MGGIVRGIITAISHLQKFAMNRNIENICRERVDFFFFSPETITLRRELIIVGTDLVGI